MAETSFAAKALALLAAAYPHCPGATLAELQIGERDRRLLALREQVFGRRLAGSGLCPACASRVEFEIGVHDVTVPPLQAENSASSQFLISGDYEVSFHIPTTRDLSTIECLESFEDRVGQLLHRVIDTALWRGNKITCDELPQSIVDELEARLEEADPQGDVRLNLVCGVCGREWEELFDIASFLWAEVHAWAIRLMRQVHTLARAYGWGESEILALSPWRRQRYLEMLSE
jgi:hypothetical protein